MAFIQTGMSQSGASLTTPSVPVSWIYQQTADTLTTIRASGYFNDWTNNLSQNDYLYIVGSDGADWVNVSSATGAATVTTVEFITAGDIADGSITAAKLATDAVETVKIKDANVTLAKLAAGITPSHVVKFAAKLTTVGGTDTETFSVSGITSTDFVYTQLIERGTNIADILQAVTGTNEFVVKFTIDPGNDAEFYYQILRAAT